jgi:hypothetical protein
MAAASRAAVVVVAIWMAQGGWSGAGAQDTPVDTTVTRAVKRGLDYLKRKQTQDGAWRADVGFKLNERYQRTLSVRQQLRARGGHVGVSSLAILAFLAGGHVPGRGPYGEVIESGVRYVLSCVNPEDGYISQNGTRMYSHAFATLCLAEIYGMTHQADLREKLQDAVDLIVKSQNKTGSWRYLPFASDSDMSITVCQVQSLRAARNVGLRVPRSTIDRAIDYIKDSAIGEGPEKGAFKYQAKTITRSSFPLTAAGITALYGAGVYDDDAIKRGLDYLVRNHEHLGEHYRNHYFYYYGHYYAVQAMFIAGGGYWTDYYPKIRRELLQRQDADGSWNNETGPGRAFGTAVACIILQIPKRYLPIFQR